MLVLTRKPGEQIVIGHGIRVTVVSVGPGRVKIGVEAPPEVRVDRAEIHEKVLLEAEAAADVLAAVGRPEADAPCPTVVAAGDTATRLPSPAPARHPAVERLMAHRLPRKPR
ncbi:MAG: carbon storage regulator [Gemmataceae bacterium]|nr:carbon storage regulator [Gemmataceae bacterium]